MSFEGEQTRWASDWSCTLTALDARRLESMLPMEGTDAGESFLASLQLLALLALDWTILIIH